MHSARPSAIANRVRAKAVHSVSNWMDAFHRWHEPPVGEFLTPFVPNSAGVPRALREQTRNGVLPVLESLSRLHDVTSGDGSGTDSIALDLEEFVESRGGNALMGEELGRLLDLEGSDKSRDHGYESLYAQLLAENVDCGALVEVGIGSPNPLILSNMGPQARPGASLRAFRSFCGPTLVLVGADAVRIARELEDGSAPTIEYLLVDQLKPESLKQLFTAASSKQPYLIIDDGLHSPQANLNVLESWQRYSEAKWLVIEDVPFESLVVWQIVQNLLGKAYPLHILRARRDYLVLVERLRPQSQTARCDEGPAT